ncbi:hypothetical protein QM012_009491 [Aureobasidium pullulans]|uniref:F-box domain-containing protein n=1 Tax=Aureobasidium pullulans TaxID=5580 RepID=A0ABR0TH14_AURPU
MPRLESLPNDILLEVYKACPSAQTAVQLSAVNKLLHSIWLDNNNANHIIRAIVTTTTPAAAQAISYAITETRLHSSMESNEQVPLNLWLPNLIRIMDLCASALAAYAARRKLDRDRSIRPRTLKTEAPSPESYYLLRRCVLAFDLPELRDALYDELSTTSQETLAEACDLQHFLNRQSSMEETIRQEVLFRMRFYEPLSGDSVRMTLNYMKMVGTMPKMSSGLQIGSSTIQMTLTSCLLLYKDTLRPIWIIRTCLILGQT